MDHPAYQSQISTSPTPGTASIPEQPVKPSGRNWKKWLLIGGIVFVTLLTGTAYVLSQQKSQEPEMASQIVTNSSPTPASNAAVADPTTDWKTYSNNQHSITFNYPLHWNVRLDDNKDKSLNIQIDNYPHDTEDPFHLRSVCKDDYMIIDVRVNFPENVGEDGAFDKFIQALQPGEEKIFPPYNNTYIREENKSYNGLTYVRYSWIANNSPSGCSSKLYATAATAKTDKAYIQISLGTNSQMNLTQNKKLFDHFLQTFKFTK